MTSDRGATLDKRYGGRAVLRRRDARRSRPGTVHALVGENGAGKSTLVKIIAGVVRARRRHARDRRRRAIDVARWDRARGAAARASASCSSTARSAGTLTVVENAVLGVEPRARAAARARRDRATALAALGDEIGLPIDPWARVERARRSARAQRAEIVAALHHGAKLLILDEPTAVLDAGRGRRPARDRCARSRRAARRSCIVTHKLDEVRAVADDVTVLRAGKTVATFATRRRAARRRRDRARDGRRRAAGAARRSPRTGGDAPTVLALERVAVGDALARRRPRGARAARSSASPASTATASASSRSRSRGSCRRAGTVAIGGRDVTRATPRARLAAGLAHIPEDRHHGGLVARRRRSPTTSRSAARDVTGRFRDRSRARSRAHARGADRRARHPARRSATRSSRALSGGNQQKVVIGRELSRPTLVAVVAAQPTRGVDLGAVARIHDRLRAAATAGAGVLVISADLDELLALCHRIVVLLRGRIVGERAGAALRATDARAGARRADDRRETAARAMHAAARARSASCQAAVIALLASIAIGSVLMLVAGKSPGHVWCAMVTRTAGRSVLARSGALQGDRRSCSPGSRSSIALDAGLFNIGGEGAAHRGRARVRGGRRRAAGRHAGARRDPDLRRSPPRRPAARSARAIGALRVYRGAHEVITSIMLNAIVAGVALWLGNAVLFTQRHDARRADRAGRGAARSSGSAAARANAVAAPRDRARSALVWWLRARTTWGQAWRAVGADPAAARRVGIDVAPRADPPSMTGAGALAGLAATNFVLGHKHAFEEGLGRGTGLPRHRGRAARPHAPGRRRDRRAPARVPVVRRARGRATSCPRS